MGDICNEKSEVSEFLFSKQDPRLEWAKQDDDMTWWLSGAHWAGSVTRLLWSKEQTLNWLINDEEINDKITTRECHTESRVVTFYVTPVVVTSTSVTSVKTQRLRIFSLLLLFFIEICWKPKITDSLRFLYPRSQHYPLRWHSHLNCCHDTGCYWGLVPVLLMGLRNTDCDHSQPRLRNLKTEDAPLCIPGAVPTPIHHSPGHSVTGPTCHVHYNSLPYNYGFFRPL